MPRVSLVGGRSIPTNGHLCDVDAFWRNRWHIARMGPYSSFTHPAGPVMPARTTAPGATPPPEADPTPAFDGHLLRIIAGGDWAADERKSSTHRRANRYQLAT